MKSKLISLTEAVSAVSDGAAVALGGNTLHRSPSAAVHELIRQGKKGLNLVKTAGAYDVDILCGAGVATAVTAGFIGFENVFGLASMYRRGVEGGQVQAREHACYSVIAGLRAAAQGVPFMPVAGLTDSDIPEAQGFRPVVDPYTGQELMAIAAIIPDVAIIHVHEADEQGNARIKGTLFEDGLMATAAHHVILTAERIVESQLFEEQPELTTIAGFMVDNVVEALHGAWPCSCAGLYNYDLDYLADYVAHTRTMTDFKEFLTSHWLIEPEKVA